MMKIIKKLSLRYQLMLWNTFLILFALITTGWAINSLVKNTVEKNMVKDLTASVVSIQKMIDTTVNASIHNYLRGIGEKNVDILGQLHKEAAAGKMDLSEAKHIAEKILLNQPIGKTGYIYALTSDGTLAVHPDTAMKNKQISEYAFVQKQIREKKGYVEYTWQNPGEDKERAKVLYMAYFEPWDWIVSVSSYREEFISLLKNSESWAVLLGEMKRAGTGTIKMNWMEKSGEAPREKLFFSHHIPSLDWFVVSSVYSDEIRQQLNPIHRIILAAILMILLVLLPFSLYLGRSITRPLVRLAREMEQAGSGVYDIRAEETASGEIGRLAAHFNAYMAKLKRIHHELNREIEERIKAVGQLKIFKKVFENALEGISITDAEGHILDVNQAFTDITGYSREEAAGQNPRILKSNRHDDSFYKEMWGQLNTRGYWAGEIWNRRKNGEAYPEILSINSIKQDDGKTTHYVAVFHDISEMKLQQEKIQHQAYHDELTGLPNRYLVHDRLSMAEETGLILQLSQYVLEEACKGLKILKERFAFPLTLSVNISPLEFKQPDFGTGYSSLYYLKKLPISTLKIDKSFIDDMTTDQNDANIVETIILMAKNLGIEVVAEGVETREQFELLAKYKCDLIQGYYYAKPMPLKDLILYLEEMS